MINLFKIDFITVTLLDIIDILLVAFIIYGIYALFKNTRASQMLIGMIILLIMGVFAQVLNLRALAWLIGSFQTVWVILFAIVFQPELRRILMYIGQNPVIRKLISDDSSNAAEELIYSVFELQKKKVGALIVVMRDFGLKAIVEKGVTLNSQLSNQLIFSIFNTLSPLHDGAIVVYQDKIVAAKCILPLSENLDIDPTIGTRHLAALGLSEESDAFIIIVSEESGKVSIAFNGVLSRGINEPTLRTELYRYLSGRNA